MTSTDQVRFVASDGTHWTVYEIANMHATWASHSLIFVSDRGFRRVYNYPPHWRSLSAEELDTLSWSK